MATIVKEKRREKKKSKLAKSVTKLNVQDEVTKIEDLSTEEHLSSIRESLIDEKTEAHATSVTQQISEVQSPSEAAEVAETVIKEENSSEVQGTVLNIQNESNIQNITIESTSEHLLANPIETAINNDTIATYKDLGAQLNLISISNQIELAESRHQELEHPNAYLKSQEPCPELIEPSAPIIEEKNIPNAPIEVVREAKKSKVPCLTLEEVAKLYAGDVISNVKKMSENEEAIVEAGPVSGPEHPLVDLLTTFRTSLLALHRERTQLLIDLAKEGKTICNLWKTEKRFKTVKEGCKCGAIVNLTVTYDYAIFERDKMPSAKMCRHKLLKDIQETYCYHQHAALLAHYQIELTIADIIQRSKSEIREALFLVLQALKMSDSRIHVLPIALQRWATVLVAALIDGRDLRQLLFVMHHMFRQNRSVGWAARLIHVPVVDSIGAAQVLAVLDTLLNNSRLETAVECNEDSAEVWEEVCLGGAGAVSEGSLRERDLLAILDALPLREMLARMLMFTDADVSKAREEWWGDSAGGRYMLAACGAVRVLASSVRARPHYSRVRARLRKLVAAALKGLACLYQSPKTPYEDRLKEKIEVEMEACFAAGFNLFDKEELTSLPTSLLMEDTAKEYCLTFITSLHEKSTKRIESLGIDAPVLPCAERVRIVTRAAADRPQHQELAGIVLDFLFQVGIKKKIEVCKGGCEKAARESIGKLIDAHPDLHIVAFRITADMSQVEQLDGSAVSSLACSTWRPSMQQLQAVIHDWSQRCEHLLTHLLLNMDYTPDSGIPLELQLEIGRFLSSHPQLGEHRWSILRKLKTHAVWWTAAPAAPAPNSTQHMFDKALALLSTTWGHSVPIICSEGVSALLELASERVLDATHCLAPIMLVMTSSPESISLTPKFGDVFATIAGQGPSLVARAFGRGGISGAGLLHRLALTQVNESKVQGVVTAWLHALWSRGLMEAGAGSGAGVGLLATAEALALACRDWPALDEHATFMLQESNSCTLITNAVRFSSTAPLLCEVLLRCYHKRRELNTQLFAALINVLTEQRNKGQKIHVDNSLQKIGATISSEELSIYRCASAALSAPPQHPAHLTLWRMFFHLYLQRTTDTVNQTAVGPLFYSGLIKSRTLSQIKKKLQESITYHHKEAAAHKKISDKLQNNTDNKDSSQNKSKNNENLFPQLSLKELIGDLSFDSDSDESDVEIEAEGSVKEDGAAKRIANMAAYHTGAEKILSEYLGWLESSEKVKAMPHHADIARLIPHTALEEAWWSVLSTMRPPSTPEVEDPPVLSDLSRSTPKTVLTPLQAAIEALMTVKDKTKLRSKPTIRSPLDDIDFKRNDKVVSVVESHYKEIGRYAREWSDDATRIQNLDNKLWELIPEWRKPFAIAPIKKTCPNKCPKSVTMIIGESEYLLNASADEEINVNRSDARAAVRRLTRPKPQAAKSVALLQAIASRINNMSIAFHVVEVTWRAAPNCDDNSIIKDVFYNVFSTLVQRWLVPSGGTCVELVSRWCRSPTSPLQHSLLATLITPRSARDLWPQLYSTILHAALPPHIVFSYLSKFELAWWSTTANDSERRELISAMFSGVQLWAVLPPESGGGVVLELLALQTAVACSPRVLPHLLMLGTKMAVESTLPELFWVHLNRAAETLSSSIEFDQLGHLLRSLGAAWKPCMGNMTSPAYVTYAPHIATLLHIIVDAFVKAAINLSYEPARVAWYAWGAMLEAWEPWIVPHNWPAFPQMSTSFVDGIQQILLRCPGCEIKMLQQVFEWAIQTQAPAAMLNELSQLPWDSHQWFSMFCLQFAAQCPGETEYTRWACTLWRSTLAYTLVDLVPPEHLAIHLAHLLYFFIITPLKHQPQFVEEATKLPWWLLPEPPFTDNLERFFTKQHTPALPYHELPQFKVLLFAGELKVLSVRGQFSSMKRSRLVSAWTCASAAPHLTPHVTTHVACVLQLIQQLDAVIENLNELEDLISRAMAIMCMEPAATSALQVWCNWLLNAPPRCVVATVGAAALLTVQKYSALIADVAISTLLNTEADCELTKLSADWSNVRMKWIQSPWRDSTELVSRGSLYSAYACVLAHGHNKPANIFVALQAASVNFVEDELIVAVWILHAARISRECIKSNPRMDQDPLTEQRESSPALLAREVVVAARSLLRAWSQPPKRSLIKMITLKVDTDVPTQKLRLLSVFAQCVIEPIPRNVNEFESQATSVLGADAPNYSNWGSTANLTKLSALALKLYPKHKKYFQIESEIANDMERSPSED